MCTIEQSVNVSFDIVSIYDELSRYFPKFVKLTMDYFIWNYQSRFDHQPEVWQQWARDQHTSCDIIIQNFHSQRDQGRFSEAFTNRYRQDYERGMWTVLGINTEHVLIATARLLSRNHSECEIHSVYVDPEYRNKGVGSKLLDRLLELARQEGFSRVLLSTFPFMQGALHLYTSRGFTPVEFVQFDTMSRELAEKTGIVCMELKLVQPTE